MITDTARDIAIDATLTTLAQVSADRATIVAAIERASEEPTDELIRAIGETCSERIHDILAEQLGECGIKGAEARVYTDYRN